MSIQLNISPQTKQLKNINNEKPKQNLLLDKYHIQLLTSFGGDTSGNIKDCINFVTRNDFIIYAVGNTVMIRELSYNDNDKEKLASVTHLSKQNNIFIHQLSPKSKRITSLNVSKDKNSFILSEELEDENNNIYSTISVYFLGKFNILSDKYIEPARKIITDKYLNIHSLSLGYDNDYLCGICTEIKTGKLRGIIYDLQTKKKFELNESLPVSLFEIDQNTTKITYNRKIIGTSGINCLNFFYLYEGKERKIQTPIIKNKNFVDHCFIYLDKNLTKQEEDKLKNKILYIVLTENNELYIIQGVDRAIDRLSLFASDIKSNYSSKFDSNLYRSDHLRIDSFIVIQYITDIFENKYSLARNLYLINQNNFFSGLIIGNKDGDLLLMERNSTINWDSSNKNITVFKKMRLIQREIKSECTGISLNHDESMLCLSFKNNEISYCDLKHSFEFMKNSNNFDLKFYLLCEGYHHSPITSMDISAERNILVTSSNKDSSIKIWNYLNGLSEYCSLVLSEQREENKQILKNFNIMALTLHPSGYYLAMSSQVMIWFFFIFYKQLKFYGAEQISINSNKNFPKRTNCNILKFSNGGRYLAAGSQENYVFLIDSYNREILDCYKINIRGNINDIWFTNDDVFIYVICNNGHIYNININTGVNQLMIKQDNINFLSSFAYLDEEIVGGLNIRTYNLLICGKDIVSENYSISEISYAIDVQKKDLELKYSNLTYLNDKVTCLLFVEFEKLQTFCIIYGTSDGKIVLTESPISQSEFYLKELYFHKGKITKLVYSKDTHLLFSCGDDGNIFITVIQEIAGDEAFYESLITNIGLVTDLEDGGLGTNILVPAWEMDKIIKTKGKRFILEKEFEEAKNEIMKKNENEINEILKEIRYKHNKEMSKLLDRINEIELEMKRQQEDNKDNIKFLINETKKKQVDEKNLFELACEDYENEIASLKKELDEVNDMYEEQSYLIEREFKNKFIDLKQDFEKRTKAIGIEDEKLQKKYLREKEDKLTFITNLEIENEMDNKNILIEQDKKNEEFKNKINKLNQEISNLQKKHSDLEDVLEEKEKEVNDLRFRVDYLEESCKSMKDQNNTIDTDTKNLKEKISELKQILEYNKITNNYEEKLRKELYKKNAEINNKYKEVKEQYDSQRDRNKLLERNINQVNTKALVIEDDRDKAYLALSVNEKENIKLKKKSKQLNNLLDEIISKVYKSLQTINKNEVYKCANDLYRLFLTEEYKNTINKNSLDVDILYEFGLKIQSLEKKLSSDKNHIKFLQESQERNKIKMFKDNSSLLSGCTSVTKKSVNLLRNVENLNSEIKLLEESKLNNSSSIIMTNGGKNNKNRMNRSQNKKLQAFESNSSRYILPPISNIDSSGNKNKEGTFGTSENL